MLKILQWLQMVKISAIDANNLVIGLENVPLVNMFQDQEKIRKG